MNARPDKKGPNTSPKEPGAKPDAEPDTKKPEEVLVVEGLQPKVEEPGEKGRKGKNTS